MRRRAWASELTLTLHLRLPKTFFLRGWGKDPALGHVECWVTTSLSPNSSSSSISFNLSNFFNLSKPYKAVCACGRWLIWAYKASNQSESASGSASCNWKTHLFYTNGCIVLMHKQDGVSVIFAAINGDFSGLIAVWTIFVKIFAASLASIHSKAKAYNDPLMDVTRDVCCFYSVFCA